MSLLEVRDLNVETIGGQLDRLREMTAAPYFGETVTLRLQLEHEPEPFAGALLAQAVLRLRPDVDFVVRLPEDQVMISSLVRSGVASALSRWGERIRFEPPVDALAGHRLWHNWTPSAREAMAPMFGAGESATGLFGPTHALFINPHLTSDPEGPAAITMLVRRWLTQMVAPQLSPEQNERAIDGPLFTVDQLVRNVSEHAITDTHPSVDSMVSLQVSELARRRELRVTVLDTGAGIAATLRPKLGVECGAPTDAEMLGALLRGELPGWGRGRGFGLGTIGELVLGTEDATLELWSGSTCTEVDAEVSAQETGVEVTGTVFSASFPLPAR